MITLLDIPDNANSLENLLQVLFSLHRFPACTGEVSQNYEQHPSNAPTRLEDLQPLRQ